MNIKKIVIGGFVGIAIVLGAFVVDYLAYSRGYTDGLIDGTDIYIYIIKPEDDPTWL